MGLRVKTQKIERLYPKKLGATAVLSDSLMSLVWRSNFIPLWLLNFWLLLSPG